MALSTKLGGSMTAEDLADYAIYQQFGAASRLSMSLKFGGGYHFSGQITSEMLLQDNPRLGIGGQVAVERLNLPTHAADRLYYR
ncbi:MAG: hypothetical protein WA785_21350, partial [Candidatus Acidiferrales bacterium]